MSWSTWGSKKRAQSKLSTDAATHATVSDSPLFSGLNIPAPSPQTDAVPIDPEILRANRAAHNDQANHVMHGVKWTPEQFQFLLDQTTQQMADSLKELYASYVVEEGEFILTDVEYLGPGKPGHCGEPKCNRRIGTKYFVKPKDPTAWEEGSFPEWVGSDCIQKLAGIDENTAKAIRKSSEDARKGVGPWCAEEMRKWGTFDRWFHGLKIDQKIASIESATDEEIADLFNYDRRFRDKTIDEKKGYMRRRMARVEEFLNKRVPAPEKEMQQLRSWSNTIDHKREYARRQKQWEEESAQRRAAAEARQKEEAARQQKIQEERSKVVGDKMGFCESLIATGKAGRPGGFIYSCYDIMKKGRNLTEKQSAVLEKIMKQHAGEAADAPARQKEPAVASAQLEPILRARESVMKVVEEKRAAGQITGWDGAEHLEKYLDGFQPVIEALEQGYPLSEDLYERANKFCKWLPKGSKRPNFGS